MLAPARSRHRLEHSGKFRTQLSHFLNAPIRYRRASTFSTASGRTRDAPPVLFLRCFTGKRAAVFSSVLIVDPDRHTLDFCVPLLTDHAAAVDYAANGRDALFHALDRPPALLICEAHLSVLNGYDLFALLRQRPAPPRAIILTPRTDPQLARERAAAAGAEFVLEKPLTVEAFREALRELRERVGAVRRRGEVLYRQTRALLEQSEQLRGRSSELRQWRKSKT